MCVLGAAAGPETLQAVVSDLQDKATVHHTVRRLQVAMGNDDTVVKEQHALVTKTATINTNFMDVPPLSELCVTGG